MFPPLQINTHVQVCVCLCVCELIIGEREREREEQPYQHLEAKCVRSPTQLYKGVSLYPQRNVF